MVKSKTIDRVKHAASHGAHGNVTALKSRRVIAKKHKISYIRKICFKRKLKLNVFQNFKTGANLILIISNIRHIHSRIKEILVVSCILYNSPNMCRFVLCITIMLGLNLFIDFV